MPLAYSVGPTGGPLPLPLLDHLQKEWEQCRQRIEAVDGTLADLRKFGFSLITGLLAASGLVGGAAGLLGASKPLPQGVVSALVAINCILVFVLYVVDRYYVVIQQGAVQRAIDLERALNLRLSLAIAGVARDDTVWRYASMLQYGLFIFASLALGLALILVRAPSGGTNQAQTTTSASSGSLAVSVSGIDRGISSADFAVCSARHIDLAECAGVIESRVSGVPALLFPVDWIVVGAGPSVARGCLVNPARCERSAEVWVANDWWLLLLLVAPVLSITGVIFLGIKANRQTEQLQNAGHPVFAVRWMVFPPVATPAIAAGHSVQVTAMAAANDPIPPSAQLISASRYRDNGPGENVRIVNCQVQAGQVVFTLANFTRGAGAVVPDAVAATDDVYAMWYVDSPLG
jgi:hypothetical protein